MTAATNRAAAVHLQRSATAGEERRPSIPPLVDPSPHVTRRRLILSVCVPDPSGKKDLNRLYNIMMSYDYSGNEWQRFAFWNDEVRISRRCARDTSRRHVAASCLRICNAPRT